MGITNRISRQIDLNTRNSTGLRPHPPCETRETMTARFKLKAMHDSFWHRSLQAATACTMPT